MLCSVVVVVRFLCYVFSCFAICCVVCAVQCSCVSSVWYESGFVPNNRQWSGRGRRPRLTPPSLSISYFKISSSGNMQRMIMMAQIIYDADADGIDIFIRGLA